MGNNGHSNGNEAVNGNGTTDLTPGVRARNSDDRSRTLSRNGDELTNYLHGVVEEFVDSTTPVEGRPPLDLSKIDGEIPGRLGAALAESAVPLIYAKPTPRWKRVFDLVCIVLTLPIWLPLLVLVIAWIKMVSPGPVFYRQERVGYRRRRFMLFKFRTMHVNAETRSHEEYFAQLMRSDRPMTKLDALDDNRLIRCGRLLRASGLDELPQIFNVLRGEMSLVGPRPCLPNEFQLYSPSQQQRVSALPGLTGYWQVNGKNKTTFSEMIAMDLFYSENMSPSLDLCIILKTVPLLMADMLEARSRRVQNDMMALTGNPASNGAFEHNE